MEGVHLLQAVQKPGFLKGGQSKSSALEKFCLRNFSAPRQVCVACWVCSCGRRMIHFKRVKADTRKSAQRSTGTECFLELSDDPKRQICYWKEDRAWKSRHLPDTREAMCQGETLGRGESRTSSRKALRTNQRMGEASRALANEFVNLCLNSGQYKPCPEESSPVCFPAWLHSLT